MSKFCVHCGNEIKDGTTMCEKCGSPVDGNTQGQTVVNQTVVNNVPEKSNGLAITGFITSLVSFVCCGCSLSLISLILSIVGVVKAGDYNGKGKGLAIAGIIISAIGLILMFVVFPFMIGFFSGFIEEMA